MALVMLIVFSVLFAATHIVLSHGSIRKGLVDSLGQWGFRGVYSVVSFITLGGAIAIFIGHRSAGPQLWSTPGWLYPLVYVLILMAFLLMALMLANPSPAGMMPAQAEARGVLRITRHPMNMGIALFALAHIIANGSLGDVFFFGSLFVTGFVGAYHQDSRKVKELGEDFRIFQTKTSVFPFVAVIFGKTKLSLEEFSVPLLAVAGVAYLAVIFLHSRLFGVAPW